MNGFALIIQAFLDHLKVIGRPVSKCHWCGVRIVETKPGIWSDWDTDGDEYTGWFAVCGYGRRHEPVG